MAFPAEHRYRSEITGGPGTLPAPKNIPPVPTGNSGHSRGLRRSQHSEGWHPHCRCSTRGARLPLPQAGQPGPGPLRTREGWGTSGTWRRWEGGYDGSLGCCVCGSSHLRLCPAGLVLGLGSWLHRDVKATCLIQGSFFGELWTEWRGTAPSSRHHPPNPMHSISVPCGLSSQPIFLDLLSVAADVPS